MGHADSGIRSQDLLRHGDFLRALARGILRDEHRAEDLVQQAYVSALEHPPRSRRALRSWLGRVVRNLAVNSLRTEGRRRDREHAAARREAQPPDDRAARELHVQQRVLDAVVSLREPHRTVIHLRYFRGLSTSEIGEELGLPLKTVKSRLTRAHARLRERLDRESGGDRRAWATLLASFVSNQGPVATTGSGLLGGTLATKEAALLLACGLALLATWTIRTHGTSAPGGTRGEAAVLRDPIGAPATVEVPALAADRELVVPRGGRTTSRVELRLVDAKSGEPVPSFLVEVEGLGEGARRLESDSEGVIRSAEAWPSCELVVHAIDHPDMTPSPSAELAFHHDAGAAPGSPPELSLPVGPTYRLDMRIPDGEDVSGFDVTLDQVAFAPVGFEACAPLRDGERPWVRFAGIVPSYPTEPPYGLTVSSDDGYWWGRAEVRSNRGVYPEIVPIELGERGRVTGRVLAGDVLQASNEPYSATGRVSLVTRDPDWELVGREFVDAEGRFDFKHVRPGSYLLRAETSQFSSEPKALEVVPGRTTECDVRVRRIEGLAAIRGKLRSRSGAKDLSQVVVMLATEGFSRYFVARPRTQETDGKIVGDFVFEDVPPDDYTLWVDASLGHEWTPNRIPVHPGDAGIELVCEDDVPLRELVFRAVDAVTRDPLDYFSVSVRERVSSTTVCDRDEEAVSFTVADGRRLDWMVSAKGYAPAWGDASSLEGPGGPRELVVELHPGWGNELTVRLPDDTAVPGALVLLDGEEAGLTDAEGRIRLARPERPATLSILYRDWTIANGMVDPETGSFTEAPFGILVTLAPPD